MVDDLLAFPGQRFIGPVKQGDLLCDLLLALFLFGIVGLSQRLGFRDELVLQLVISSNIAVDGDYAVIPGPYDSVR